MTRLLILLPLSATAFALGWWLTPVFPLVPASISSGLGAEVQTSAAFSQGGGAGFGFARREAMLRRMENPGLAEIHRLLDSSELGDGDRRRLSRIWAAADPAGFWKWLREGDSRRYLDADLAGLFSHWLRLDPEAAIAAYRGSGGRLRRSLAFVLFELQLGGDERTKRRLAPLRNQLLASIASDGTDYGMGEWALNALKELPPCPGRDKLLASNLRNLMGNDWKAASQWLSTLDAPLKTKLMSDLVPGLLVSNSGYEGNSGDFAEIRKDPACRDWVRQWFMTEAPAEVRRKLGVSFAGKLAETDPAAALAWARENLSALPLTEALSRVLKMQAEKDPAAALDLATSLPPGVLRKKVLSSLSSTILDRPGLQPEERQALESHLAEP